MRVTRVARVEAVRVILKTAVAVIILVLFIIL